MKLLRDFFRLRVARPGRRADSRSWTITVPAPLAQVQSVPSSDTHRLSDAPRGLQVARRKEHAAPQAHRHLQLVSSH
ncbi:hypothetical protein [Dyella japonica]|uniref:Uncharacterized protein n=1 Tax=Dyella japonica A8 TaxID=1217721 RepID=A0A075JX40_9GAMM|nr:hypothetical protein [Dyella japonica]AIF46676.1 hypothetical protein HY57_05075 [Dyella japonica A8]